jgi:general secretion pathway protein D
MDQITAGPFAMEVDNSILVKGTPEGIRQLRDIIRYFDVAPKQLSVKAEFITVSENDQNSFGINWNFERVNLQAGANTGFSTTNTAFITYAVGNLQTQMSFILSTGRGKLVSAPTATTFNNFPVQFAVGEEYPVFISTPIVSQNGTVALSTTITPVPIFTTLVVLPRINADNTITLIGSVAVSGVQATVTGPDGETAPIVTSQAVQIQRRIHNGDTMVVGGLITKNDSISQDKVPLLGDLPLIGNLFKSHNVTIADSELLAFITPSIILESDTQSQSRASTASNGLLAPGSGPAAGPGTGGSLTP